MRIESIALLAFRLAWCTPCLFGIGIVRPVVYEIPLPKSRILRSVNLLQSDAPRAPATDDRDGSGTDLGRIESEESLMFTAFGTLGRVKGGSGREVACKYLWRSRLRKALGSSADLVDL